jgi:MinD superfamily P-loop ATPase
MRIGNGIIISVASGKGGTGKTTVAASLAYVTKGSVFIDCDVEEPNGHLLLRPTIFSEESACKTLPEIAEEQCIKCKKCVLACEFNALVYLGFKIVLIDELCHSCGACWYLCPSKIITQKQKEIGVVRVGTFNGDNYFAEGLLNIGETSAVPLIKEVKKKIIRGKINIIDSPPGTSCSMMETVKKSNFCILVTESSPFGLNDLKLAINVLEPTGVPYGVVINKYEPEYEEMENYLTLKNITVLLKVPFDKRYAELYSEGILPVTRYPELRQGFEEVSNQLMNILEKPNVN